MPNDKTPGPDPGNAPPEDWTAPLTDEEAATVWELIDSTPLDPEED